MSCRNREMPRLIVHSLGYCLTWWLYKVFFFLQFGRCCLKITWHSCIYFHQWLWPAGTTKNAEQDLGFRFGVFYIMSLFNVVSKMIEQKLSKGNSRELHMKQRRPSFFLLAPRFSLLISHVVLVISFPFFISFFSSSSWYPFFVHTLHSSIQLYLLLLYISPCLPLSVLLL